MTTTTWISNSELALRTLQALKDRGIKTIVVCPGARNSPWIAALTAETRLNFEVLHHFDERAAGFFALGCARSSTLPVAVITTSGTAVGELLPSVMEAYYSGTSVFFLTADRPRRFRGTGAPQSCEQAGIFGVYAVESHDIDGASDLEIKNPHSLNSLPNTGPVHWNVCFEEPQNETLPEQLPREIPEFSQSVHPLVIVGELSRDESRMVSSVLKSWGYPVITEALSQLAEDLSLNDLRIRPHGKLYEEAAQSGYEIDSIIRIGGVPTLRFWRDLEVHPKASGIPVLSISPLPFSGLPRAQSLRMPLRDLYRLTVPAPRFSGTDSYRLWKQSNQTRTQHLNRLLEELPGSEPGVFRSLSRTISNEALVYLGNSLPIREWDLAALPQETPSATLPSRIFAANRGLNGIDGQLSTFFGMLESNSREHWCLLGDLTTLYDLNAPWILHSLIESRKNLPQWHLVVINNHGGRIFDRIFKDPSYVNAHTLNFQDWASQWGLSYARVAGHGLSEFLSRHQSMKLAIPQVLEIQPDPEATSRFWNEWETLNIPGVHSA
ncbi:MAG: hypothetical protein RJB38_2031 [Pseudomonadota bacterium]